MEEETIGSQGLFQSSFLKQLVLDTLEWKGALLLKALAEDDVNRSIECLRLEVLISLLMPKDETSFKAL
ncbi:hypothetical protein MPTK1_4g10930 [Marchantia polymorpha subsp. ruderalis]